MAVLGNRATGLLDFLNKIGGQNLPMAKAPTSPAMFSSNQQPPLFPPGQVFLGPTARAVEQAPVRPDMNQAGVRLSAEQLQARMTPPAPPTEEPSFMDRASDVMGSTFGDESWRIRKAIALNSMRLNPDAGLAAALTSRLQSLDEERKSRMASNRTADALEQFDPKLAQAIRDGMDPKTALEIYQSQRKGVVVGKKIVNPYTAEVIYDGTGEGGDVPEALKTLIGRAKEAGLKPGTDEYRQFMINGGQRSGLQLKVGADGSVELTEGGTGSTTKLTDSQSNALAFGGRMQASNQILSATELEGTQLGQSLLEQVPIAGNYLLSPEYQQYSQAKRNFINAVLRKESGAAIAQSEFANADKQYFPQPGDSQEVIRQKKENRDLATKLMMSGVPISGLTEDPKTVLQKISGQIQRPASVPQNIWDAMTDAEKLAFK